MDRETFDQLYARDPAVAVGYLLRTSTPGLLASVFGEEPPAPDEQRRIAPAGKSEPRKSFTIRMDDGTRLHVMVRVEKEADQP